MPARADYAEDHTGGEDDAPGEDLDDDVDPENGVDGFGGDGFAFGDVFRVVLVSEGEGNEEQQCC